MKNLLNFVLIIFTAILCTGCVQSTYDFTIDKHNNVTIKEADKFNYLPMQNGKFRDKVFEDIASYTAGKDFKTFSDADGNTDVEIIQKSAFSNASKILPFAFSTNENELAFSIDKGLASKKYKIHLFYNQNQALLNMKNEATKFQQSSPTFKQNKSYLSRFIMSKEVETSERTGTKFLKTTYADGNVMLSKYDNNSIIQDSQQLPPQAVLRIKTPKKAYKHNAHRVISNTEYEWNLSGGNMAVEIILEYKYFDISSLILLLSMLALTAGGIVLRKKFQDEPAVKGL